MTSVVPSAFPVFANGDPGSVGHRDVLAIRNRLRAEGRIGQRPGPVAQVCPLIPVVPRCFTRVLPTGLFQGEALRAGYHAERFHATAPVRVRGSGKPEYPASGESPQADQLKR